MKATLSVFLHYPSHSTFKHSRTQTNTQTFTHNSTQPHTETLYNNRYTHTHTHTHSHGWLCHTQNQSFSQDITDPYLPYPALLSPSRERDTHTHTHTTTP